MLKGSRLKISVRILMLLILVVGILLAWRVNKARRQREAVAAIRANGGLVHYDYEFVPGAVTLMQANPSSVPQWGTLTPGRNPPAPNWLRRTVGDEYFQEIAHVSFLFDIATGARHETMVDRMSADDMLAKLAGQTGIKTLQLGWENVTGRGMAAIGQIPALEELVICDADEITDRDLAHLEGLKNLRVLLISDTWLTVEALRHVGRLPNLEYLSLDGQCGSDRGLEYLKGMTRLRTLRLGPSASGITNAGIGSLAGLKDLEWLELDGCRAVTDDGLERLRGLRNLAVVRLRGSRTTKEGRERFMASMPTLMKLN
jgi:hypothetical protein